MINLNNISNDEPFLIFKKIYEKAVIAGQKNIEAVCISSYSSTDKEPNARFVNLKFVDNKKFIFFTNYMSPKANEFKENNKICSVFFWNEVNIQIRIKAEIKKTGINFNNEYFLNRAHSKNALAISSNQSKPINSYKQVKENYNKSLKDDDLEKRPEYWGGYSFTPYYFEFWEGHESRLNKREAYEKRDDSWKHLILQP